VNGPRQDEPSPRKVLWRRLLWDLFQRFSDDILVVVAATVAAFVRAMGVTIQSGWTGLRFTLGRADRELAPGFHVLVPFLQRARRVPTRSRTLDLPLQRVASFEGLVYHADANLVYRVVDVRKALIEIDKLEKGMLQMLGLGVQEVLRGIHRSDLAAPEALNAALAENLTGRLAPWGVAVERAGFPTITPSLASLRITQLPAVVGQREGLCARLVGAGVAPDAALGLIGTRLVPRPHREAARRYAGRRARVRRARARLKQAKWTAVEIRRAEQRLRQRLAAVDRTR